MEIRSKSTNLSAVVSSYASFSDLLDALNAIRVSKSSDYSSGLENKYTLAFTNADASDTAVIICVDKAGMDINVVEHELKIEAAKEHPSYDYSAIISPVAKLGSEASGSIETLSFAYEHTMPTNVSADLDSDVNFPDFASLVDHLNEIVSISAGTYSLGANNQVIVTYVVTYISKEDGTTSTDIEFKNYANYSNVEVDHRAIREILASYSSGLYFSRRKDLIPQAARL